MSNFETACNLALNNWVNDIEEISYIEYSENHINKMNSIIKGKRIFNVYVSKNVFKLIVAAAIVISLSIISFGVYEAVQSKNLSIGKSKIWGNNVLTIEGLDVDKAQDTPVTEFEYNYIPEGYVQDKASYFDAKSEKLGYYAIRRFNNGDKHLEICKAREDTAISLLDEHEWNYKTIEQNGITYLMESAFDENGNEIRDISALYWDCNGYVYFIFGPISVEEALKIAENMK